MVTSTSPWQVKHQIEPAMPVRTAPACGSETAAGVAPDSRPVPSRYQGVSSICISLVLRVQPGSLPAWVYVLQYCSSNAASSACISAPVCRW